MRIFLKEIFMRKHNGMRPHDIAVLLKIISLENKNWNIKKLSDELFISQSEICESLNRCFFAGLLDKSKKIVMKMSLYDFLVYGLKYVFPVKPEGLTSGIPTAHSAPPVSNEIISNGVNYVWEEKSSQISGFAIEPLYKNVVLAVQEAPEFYELMALVDTLRVGRIREVNIARNELRKRFKIEQPILQAV